MDEIDSSLSAEKARSILQYDEKTGFLARIFEKQGSANGPRAGCARKDGYRSISVLGRLYQEHRLIWLMAKGCWPAGDIDHINGNRSDNKIENLRDIPHLGNTQNRRSAQVSNRSTGLLGVTQRRPGKWSARIKVHGKNLHLGDFNSPIAAHEAYLVAKRAHHAGCTI